MVVPTELLVVMPQVNFCQDKKHTDVKTHQISLTEDVDLIKKEEVKTALPRRRMKGIYEGADNVFKGSP